MNHMSADVNQLQSFFYPFANQLVTGPAMLIASIVLLWCGSRRPVAGSCSAISVHIVQPARGRADGCSLYLSWGKPSADQCS